MCAFEGPSHGILGDVRVDLGRRDARMSEQLLHDAQVAASLDEVRGEAVAQHVRRHRLLDAGCRSVTLDDSEDALSRDPAAAHVEDQRVALLQATEERPTTGEVAERALGRRRSLV